MSLSNQKILEKNESWAKAAGFLFRPGFRNELIESVYEQSQLEYRIMWREMQTTLRKRGSTAGVGLYNHQLYLQWGIYIRK